MAACDSRARPVSGTISTETGRSVFAWSSATGLSSIGALSDEMRPDYINQHGALTGTYLQRRWFGGLDFFWSRATGLMDIGTLGGNENLPDGDQRKRHDRRVR